MFSENLKNLKKSCNNKPKKTNKILSYVSTMDS